MHPQRSVSRFATRKNRISYDKGATYSLIMEHMSDPFLTPNRIPLIRFSKTHSTLDSGDLKF